MYETLSVHDNIMVSLQEPTTGVLHSVSEAERPGQDRIWEILEFVELADKAATLPTPCPMANGNGSNSAC
jgi:ABC-type uncharacterized transport system ATPase subunit